LTEQGLIFAELRSIISMGDHSPDKPDDLELVKV
jgi:hypothetical protein